VICELQSVKDAEGTGCGLA